MIVRRQANHIEALEHIHRNWHCDDEGIKPMVRNFFLTLFTDDHNQYYPYTLPASRFTGTEERDRIDLEKSYTGSEVK